MRRIGVMTVTWDATQQARSSALAPLAEVRKVKLEATQRLLGDTIALSERAWQQPSGLPGWTRAHVATHVARNADAFVRAVDSVLMGRRGLMYDSDEDRDLAIERGSERSGLDLQIDLDTSAGKLNRRFNVLDAVPGDLMVELNPGQLLRSDLLPLVRLNEVVLHHIDLRCGFEASSVQPMTARWLLEWNVLNFKPARGTSVRLIAESGFNAELGSTWPTTVVAGPDALLLGWLTGRLSPTESRDLPEQPPLR